DHIVYEQNAVPAPLNYAPPGYTPYPKSICTSINHQVCHGIPNDRPLKNGDIVNIDVTVIKDGWHGDTSRMFIVGEGSIAARRLIQITYDAMWKGIAKVKPGVRLGDIGSAIQLFTENQGFSVVREFCGHGIGQRFHEDPQVLHYGKPGTPDELKPGMTFTIAPVVNARKRENRQAVGGYGRGELFPYSDVDVLVLLPSGAPGADEARGAAAGRFITACWDAGLEIGSSVRSVDECVAMALSDVTVQTALLESRFLCG